MKCVEIDRAGRIADGHSRVAAARVLGLETIAVELREETAPDGEHSQQAGRSAEQPGRHRD
jgi:ParB-like chromosome segregation protein Spo0J